MKQFSRTIDIFRLLKEKSYFLFGPRQTGKTFLWKHSFPKEITAFDLLDTDRFLEFSRRPAIIREILEASPVPHGIVIIDEIQKIPALLDEIHLLMEKHGWRFLLTGSSARKLRRGGVNLLGGRAREQILHPLIFQEIKETKINLTRMLNYGTLPSILKSNNPAADLRTYVKNYLQQEIIEEAIVRDVGSFSRFLEIASLCNGQILNYTQIGSDSKVPRRTVSDYFDILKDTLIGYEVPAWRRSKKRKALETSKFYFFDVGVARAIAMFPPLSERSADLGLAFEHYIFHELKAYIDYLAPHYQLSYWRSTTGFEVDFLLGNHLAIEVKAKKTVGNKDLKGILAFKEEATARHHIVISLEGPRRLVEGVLIINWCDFLESLWRGEFSE